MPAQFAYTFETPIYKGASSFPAGLFIDGAFVEPVEGGTIEVVNPSNGRVIGKVSLGTAKDIDVAVHAARKAYKTAWGLRMPGAQRGKLLNKLADLMEQHKEELAALETLNVGKAFSVAKHVDIEGAIACIRYYAGWADKNHGKTIETNERKLAYTRHEPMGVVGVITPWNLPLYLLTWKLGPALATGNTVVVKPSEITPLTALFLCSLVKEAGFPSGVLNVVVGLGETAGQAVSEHHGIDKVAFTGSIRVGRKVMEAASRTNLKPVTLELGGKSPTIVFDDCDLEESMNWIAHGVYFNQGQACCAGTRIYVQEGIYDEFIERFTRKTRSVVFGDPFDPETHYGPQVSQAQFDRVMGYINSGIQEGATVHFGGKKHGDQGFFIQPTIFTDCKPNMKIAQEEIFGPVSTIMKFKDEEDVIQKANDTSYGLACSVFSKDINRCLTVAHNIEAGTAWVNLAVHPEVAIPFGGYKQSGIGREAGEYALANYTHVKAVHVNLGYKI